MRHLEPRAAHHKNSTSRAILSRGQFAPYLVKIAATAHLSADQSFLGLSARKKGDARVSCLCNYRVARQDFFSSFQTMKARCSGCINYRAAGARALRLQLWINQCDLGCIKYYANNWDRVGWIEQRWAHGRDRKTPKISDDTLFETRASGLQLYTQIAHRCAWPEKWCGTCETLQLYECAG